MCKRFIVCVLAVLVLGMSAKAQEAAASSTARWAVSTNAVDWAWCITPNINAQYAVSPKWSVEAVAKYNNWNFGKEDRNRQARMEFSAGVRWWPWYVYSGWWASGRLQYQQYSRRPLSNAFQKEEGDALGLAFAGGYSLQVKPWLNIDFGLGFWLGGKSYMLYEASSACPECGRRIDADDNLPPSRSFFFLPNEAIISAMFIF